MAACKSCGARIIWCDTAAGNRMPVDVEPHAGGTIVVNHLPNGFSRDASPPVATVLAGDELATARAARGPDAPRLRRSHFATCPNADAHRKPKTPKETPTP